MLRLLKYFSTKTDISKFRSSTSIFNKEEERSLNIKINHTDNPGDIFYDTTLKELNSEFILREWNDRNILLYDPVGKYDLTTDQRRFLYHLRNVITNNREKYVDELIHHLLEKIGFDDSRELFLMPCQLRLEIEEKEFAAIADRECRRHDEIICLLQEDKHEGSKTYKRGDLQLACAMIAGYQKNHNRLEKVYPQRMMGLKVVADRFYFASTQIRVTRM
jgi:hypothetical protein